MHHSNQISLAHNAHMPEMSLVQNPKAWTLGVKEKSRHKHITTVSEVRASPMVLPLLPGTNNSCVKNFHWWMKGARWVPSRHNKGQNGADFHAGTSRLSTALHTCA